MSNYERKGYTPNIFPDGSVDKTNYETSQTDSGFLSGNIRSEEFDIKSQSSIASESKHYSSASMKFDSGVGIDVVTQSLSDLNFKSSDGLNDLNSGSIKCPTSTSAEKKSTYDCEKENWEIYYAQDENGDTFLHQAVEQFFPEVALAVIKAAPRPCLLDTLNDFYETALHLAVMTRQWKIVRMLIVAGAKAFAQNRQGDTPLHIAARTGDVECLKALTYPVQDQELARLGLQYHPNVYEVYLDEMNFVGLTCVHIAASHRHFDFLRHLEWLGADVNAREGTGGYTALHYAVQKNDEQLVRFLLSFNTIDVSVLTYGRKTPLEIGYPGVQKNIEKMLNDRGVPSADISDDEGCCHGSDFSDDSDDEMMCEAPSY